MDSGINTGLSGEELPWFALYVKTHHEKCVAKALHGKDYHEFLPLYRGRHRRHGRFQDVDLPLFPNYVFCRFHSERRLPILQTPGVFQIVGTTRGPEPVAESEINTIQRLINSGLNAHPWPFLKNGDCVRVVEGPLKGCLGFIETTRNESRLIVSVSMLQRSVAVNLDRKWVRPAPSGDQTVY